MSDDQVKTIVPINNFDIASYRQRVKGLNTPDICTLITNVFRPHKNYVFPRLSEKNKRTFKYEWLDLFPWLCYSALEDGAYCLSCVLFGHRFPGKSSRITRLVSSPFRYWNDAMSTFKRHARNNTGGEMGLHACTFPILTALLSQMSGVTQPIENIMSSGSKPSLSADASSLLTLITHFDFIVALVITRNILDATLPVTELLQGKSIDVMDGLNLITTLKNDVTTMRTNVDFYHTTWYEEAFKLAKEVEVQEGKKRTVGRQATRSNPPSQSFTEHYKLTITIPLLDHLQTSLNARFDLDSVNVYKGLSIVPAKMMSLSEKGIDWKEQFKTASTFYYDDLPNPLALDAELRQWFIYWDTHNGPLPDNVITTLKCVSFKGFENIKVILRILGTLPITSCECERSISALRNLKNYQRSTMVEERLNGLALMGIHTEFVPDAEEVIDKFGQGNTRLKFT